MWTWADVDGKTSTGAELGDTPVRVTADLVKQPGLGWRMVGFDNTDQRC